MKRFALLASLLVALAPAAHAGGINLSWDDCGTHGIPFRSFACNTNVGAQSLFGSFVSPAPIAQFVALEAVIDLMVNSASLSPWWDFTSTGCRANRLTADANFVAGPYSCTDPWLGQASGGLNETVGLQGPNTGRVKVIFALAPPSAIAIDGVSEYYGFRVILPNAKTVGSGACAGCDVGVCLILGQIALIDAANTRYTLTNPINRLDAYWQCPGYVATDIPGICVLSCPVPAQRETWGRVKSLYH